jgi:hypothetical protein
MVLDFVQRWSSPGSTKIDFLEKNVILENGLKWGEWRFLKSIISLFTLRTKPGPLSVRVRQTIREKHHTRSIPAMMEAIGVAEFVDSLCQRPPPKEAWVLRPPVVGFPQSGERNDGRPGRGFSEDKI